MTSCKKAESEDRSKNYCNQKSNISQRKILADLVNDYLNHYRDSYHIQAQWWGDQTLNWNAALERAWISRLENGKMHPHQYRVASKLEKGLITSQEDNVDPKSFKTFEELYQWVESITRRVNGLGSMTTYDITQRLGMWLDLSPSVVYLHRGTAKGAEKLKITGKTAPLSAFPLEIQKLGVVDAENFLCIYKEYLG